MSEPSPLSQPSFIVFGLEPDELCALVPTLTADPRVHATDLQFNRAGVPDRIRVTMSDSAPADFEQLRDELASKHPEVKIEQNVPFRFSQA